MRFTRLKLQNWRNFLDADVPLQKRAFLVGPNASGKSNFLEAFRFLRDIAEPKGSFQGAVEARHGVSQIRSLHARRYPHVAVEVEVDLDSEGKWSYLLEFGQNNQRVPIIKRERVLHNSELLVNRPDSEDAKDEKRLEQTYLEQLNANLSFRVLAEFFSQVRYLHLVPQLVREPERSQVKKVRDPFGGDFLEQLARTPRKTLESRLRRIKDALQIAVPQLRELVLERDKATGVPHLKGLYEHWRPNAGWQMEDQLSDGTLRLLGLLWVFLDGTAPLLLEEPELSLHASVVRQIPRMISRLGGRSGRQVLLSTHSADMLSDEGIAPEEVLMFQPSREGTVVKAAAEDDQVRALLEGDLTMADAVIPRTAPAEADQLVLFE
ncbi:MAG TPA: AAA family ATPase [Thermoanaerobaculia bacterium]|jgi:predicted ATPase